MLALCLGCLLTISSDAARLSRIGNDHYKNGDFGLAAVAYESALVKADESDIPLILSNLAAVEKQTGRFDRALERYREAAARRERLLGPTHGDTGLAWNNAAEMLRGLRRYPEALRELDRALACQLSPADRAIVLNNRGSVLDLVGRWTEARDAYLASIDLHGKQAADAEDLVTALTNLASLDSRQGRFAEASVWQNRALETLQARSLEKKRVGLFAFHNQAMLLYRQGRPKAARQWMERAMDLARNVVAVDSLENAILLTNYSTILLRCGEARAARRLESLAETSLPASVRYTVPAGQLLR